MISFLPETFSPNFPCMLLISTNQHSHHAMWQNLPPVEADDWVNRQWVGVVILYIRPPFVLSFTIHVMKVSSTFWTRTASHFPVPRHYLFPFISQFFSLCSKLMKSAGSFSVASVSLFTVVALPLPTSHTITPTHTFSGGSGSGEAPSSGNGFVFILVWHLFFITVGPHVFTYATTSVSCFFPL